MKVKDYRQLIATNNNIKVIMAHIPRHTFNLEYGQGLFIRLRRNISKK